jgi:hypothetical protein
MLTELCKSFRVMADLRTVFQISDEEALLINAVIEEVYESPWELFKSTCASLIKRL